MLFHDATAKESQYKVHILSEKRQKEQKKLAVELATIKKDYDACQKNYEDVTRLFHQEKRRLKKFDGAPGEKRHLKKMKKMIAKSQKIFYDARYYITHELSYDQNNHAYVNVLMKEQVANSVALSEDVYKQALKERNDYKIDYYYGFYNVTQIRKDIVDLALLCKGKIHYLWGGKSQSTDKNSLPNALDCSGFVAWVYGAATDLKFSNLYSTQSISASYKKIKKSDLKPGDLGTKLDSGSHFEDSRGNIFYSAQQAACSNSSYNEMIDGKIYHFQKRYDRIDHKIEECDNDEKKDLLSRMKKVEKIIDRLRRKKVSNFVRFLTSHVGIYVGKNKNGENVWVHCTGGTKRTVVVTTESQYNGFKYFYSPIHQMEEKK